MAATTTAAATTSTAMSTRTKIRTAATATTATKRRRRRPVGERPSVLDKMTFALRPALIAALAAGGGGGRAYAETSAPTEPTTADPTAGPTSSPTTAEPTVGPTASPTTAHPTAAPSAASPASSDVPSRSSAPTDRMQFRSMTAEQLVNELIMNRDAIEIRQIEGKGWGSDHVDECAAYYTRGHALGNLYAKDPTTGAPLQDESGNYVETDVPIVPDQGIMLSTGDPLHFNWNDADDQTTEWFAKGDHDLKKDVDLSNGWKNTVFDACVLQFQFRCPQTTASYVPEVQFKYVWSSEEYYEYVDSFFNDVFGFYLNGHNVARLPATDTNSDIVSINNVNYKSNSKYFHGNDPGTGWEEDPADVAHDLDVVYPQIEADGFTDTLLVRGTPTSDPEAWNTIKLAVGDVGDHTLDSWVLLEGASFACVDVTEGPSVSLAPSGVPTAKPSKSQSPSLAPSLVPTLSAAPSEPPSLRPTATLSPTAAPSGVPTETTSPSEGPSSAPTETASPTNRGSDAPSTSSEPTPGPTGRPSESGAPTEAPSDPPSATSAPTQTGTDVPSASKSPSAEPTETSEAPSTTARPTLAGTHPPSSSTSPTAAPLLSRVGPNAVFDDLDGDGVRDEGEGPLEGVQVYLVCDEDGVNSTTTDAQGTYEFDNVEPGECYVSVTPSVDGNDNYVFSPVVGDGSDGGNQIYPNGTSPTVTVGHNQTVDAWNAGMYLPLSAVGPSAIFDDLDRDGARDQDEPPLAGVPVTLVCDGQTVGIAASNSDGAYEFTGVQPGECHVEVTPQPDYTFSPVVVDGNQINATGISPTVTIGYN
ncbi:hypothetical protein ACHAWF_006516, partial [Thalassiosira exigua]